MEQSSEINDTSTNTAATMPNSLVAAAPNASGTENLPASSHLTEDNLAKHEAQEPTQSSIALRSSGLDEGSSTESVNGESQEDEDEDANASNYHDAAESIRSLSPVQADLLVDLTSPDAAQSTRTSSSAQTASWVDQTYPNTSHSIRSSSSVQTAIWVGRLILVLWSPHRLPPFPKVLPRRTLSLLQLNISQTITQMSSVQTATHPL
jgi:hypothetical protein